MVWTRPRDVGCQPRKTGPMKLLSSIAARERSHQGVQGGRRIGLWVLCWTKELISSSYDGGRSGSRMCCARSHRPLSVPVEPTTSRRPVVVRARSPALLWRVRLHTHAAVHRHIVRVSLRIPPHLSRPLAPPTSGGHRYLTRRRCKHCPECLLFVPKDNATKCLWSARARARYATFPRTSGRWKVMITPGSRALALPDRRG